MGRECKEKISTEGSVDTKKNVSVDTKKTRDCESKGEMSTGLSIDTDKKLSTDTRKTKTRGSKKGVSSNISLDTTKLSTTRSIDTDQSRGKMLKSTSKSVEAEISELEKSFKELQIKQKDMRKLKEKIQEEECSITKRYSENQKREFDSFKCAMEEASIELPFDLTIENMNQARRLVRGVIQNESRVKRTQENSGLGTMILHEPKEIEKRNDPGQFIIPCWLSGAKIRGALADSGANINVVTRSLLAKLGITRFEHHDKPIALADATMRILKGIIRDVPLEIEGWIVPTDFVVVEAQKEESVPLVLGRPFLTTVGAHLDFENGQIILTKLDHRTYPLLTRTMNYCGILSSIEFDEESVGENELEEEFGTADEGIVMAKDLCDAVLGSEEPEFDQEDMCIKYHVFTEMLEGSLTNVPDQDRKYYRLRKALHKVLPKLPSLKIKRRVSPLKVFLERYFNNREEADIAFGREARREGLTRFLPHRRFPDTQALDGNSLNALYTMPIQGGMSNPIDIPRRHRDTPESSRPYDFRIPTLATQENENEKALLLKPHAFFDEAIHYRVMNREGGSPFSHVSAKLDSFISPSARSRLLDEPIKMIVRKEAEDHTMVHQYQEPFPRSNPGRR